MQEIITEGKSILEAVDKACRELGVSRADVTYEVLVQPAKGFLGLFKTPARVKVTKAGRGDDFSIEELLHQDEKKAEKPAHQEPAREADKSAENKTGNASEERPHKENSGKKRHKKKNHRDNKPAENSANASSEEKATEKKPGNAEAQPKRQIIEEEISLDELPTGAKAAFEYLKTIAAGLGATALEYKAVKIHDGVKFIVDGDDAATLIGRRGETMDSLQYLCLLVSNRASEDYCKIAIDVAEYRSKREKTLEALARKVADKVKKTHYSQTLEPMNPYERRIVHSTIQEIDGVKSESVGQEPNRRVVVSLISGGKEGNGERRDRRHSGHKDGNRDRRNRGPREKREPRNNPETTGNDIPTVVDEKRELDLQAAPKEYQRIDMKASKPVEPITEEPTQVEKKPEEKNFSLYTRIDL